MHNKLPLLLSTPRPNQSVNFVDTLGGSGWLVEEERTNLLTYSEQINNAAYVKAQTGTGVAPAIGPDYGLAPDGTQTAERVIFDRAAGTTAGDVSSLTYTVAAFNTGTGSVYLKSVNGSTITIRLQVGASSELVSVTGEWQRFTLTNTTAGTDVDRFALLLIGNDGGNSSRDLVVWGAQLEAGAFATSYIPTTSAAVTRAADTVWNAAFSASELTFAVEFDLSAVVGTRPILSLDDTTADNQIRLYASGTDLKLTVTTGGVTQADLTLGTVAANTTYKAAFSCRANEFRAVMNGGAEQSDTAGTMPTVTTLRIGSDVAGNYQNGHNARTRGWTRRLPNLLRYV